MREELAERPARTLALVEALPSDAALVRSFSAGMEWTYRDELLMQLLDVGQVQILVAMAAAGVKKYKLPRFQETKRPFEVVRPKVKRRRATVEEMAEHLGAMFGPATPKS